jgi:hypothetical protein
MMLKNKVPMKKLIHVRDHVVGGYESRGWNQTEKKA